MKSEGSIVTVKGRFIEADTRTLCQILDFKKVPYTFQESPSTLAIVHKQRTVIADSATLIKYILKLAEADGAQPSTVLNES